MKRPGKIKKSLRFSFLDGVFASGMTGMTADYITPYALAFKATTGAIGILSAAPSLVSSLLQLKSADLTERFKSRRKVINTFVLLHTLMLLPIILIPLLFKAAPVLFLIIFVTLFTALNGLAMPIWSSLMSDHIPYRSRGKYFGWRSKVLGITTIIASLSAGFILHYFKNRILAGFMLIFSLAFILRLCSWYFLTRMFEPELKIDKESYFSFFDFIRRIRQSNFAKFVVFAAALNFCVSIASPFFSVFMLRDLKFSYITYTIIVVTVTITQIFTFDRWGRHADKVGNIKVLKLTSFIICGLPLLWIFSQNPGYLVFTQVISGFAWAGFNLCATNFIYDAVTPQKRVRCIAYFNALVGIAIFSGALLGGAISNILPPIFGYRLLSLFLLASILRYISVFSLVGKIKEVRTTHEITSRDLFYSVIGIRPAFEGTQSSRQVFKEE